MNNHRLALVIATKALFFSSSISSGVVAS